MALSEDQKAMLKLVSQPDTSYEDIAALMGLSVEEVRAKVDDALRQLDAAQAEEAKPPPEPAPAPAKPEPAPAPAKPEPPAPQPPPEPVASARPRLKLPEDKGARYGLFAGAAVLLILVILLITGALGGGDEGSSEAEAGSQPTATGGQGSAKTPTAAVLEEVGGSGASGQALFGRAGKNVVLLVRVKGLEPAPSGQSYTVSIGKSGGERVPLIASRPNGKGEVVGSFKIAPQILGLLASGYDRMQVSLVPDDELGAALKAAQKSGTAPSYGGTELAAGDVTGPIVEAGETEGG